MEASDLILPPSDGGGKGAAEPELDDSPPGNGLMEVELLLLLLLLLPLPFPAVAAEATGQVNDGLVAGLATPCRDWPLLLPPRRVVEREEEEESLALDVVDAVSGDTEHGIVEVPEEVDEDEDDEPEVFSLLLINCSITFSCSGVRKLFLVLKILLLLS